MTPIKKEINPKSSALIIFVRNPELGKVKTRLSKEIGPEKALEIYQRLLNHTREVSLRLDISRHLFYYEEIKEDEWLPSMFHKKIQIEGNLGEKMEHSFRVTLEEHKKVIIIGSDCAQLTHDIIIQAFDKLENNDIVIGPTYDGGYYLLGMKELHPTLFNNMEWSVSSVYQETINRISSLDLSYASLPTLSDIDYIDDWNKYGLDS